MPTRPTSGRFQASQTRGATIPSIPNCGANTLGMVMQSAATTRQANTAPPILMARLGMRRHVHFRLTRSSSIAISTPNTSPPSANSAICVCTGRSFAEVGGTACEKSCIDGAEYAAFDLTRASSSLR